MSICTYACAFFEWILLMRLLLLLLLLLFFLQWIKYALRWTWMSSSVSFNCLCSQCCACVDLDMRMYVCGCVCVLCKKSVVAKWYGTTFLGLEISRNLVDLVVIIMVMLINAWVHTNIGLIILYPILLLLFEKKRTEKRFLWTTKMVWISWQISVNKYAFVCVRNKNVYIIICRIAIVIIRKLFIHMQ